MENTLKVKELIEQLKKVDENLPVFISGIGLNKSDSWEAELQLEEQTVEVQDGFCYINFSIYG